MEDELDVHLDTLEVSSNVKISDREAFKEALRGIVRCCGDEEGEMQEEGEGPPKRKGLQVLIALGKGKHE